MTRGKARRKDFDNQYSTDIDEKISLFFVIRSLPCLMNTGDKLTAGFLASAKQVNVEEIPVVPIVSRSLFLYSQA